MLTREHVEQMLKELEDFVDAIEMGETKTAKDARECLARIDAIRSANGE